MTQVRRGEKSEYILLTCNNGSALTATVAVRCEMDVSIFGHVFL
jgi:hypothetical protein